MGFQTFMSSLMVSRRRRTSAAEFEEDGVVICEDVENIVISKNTSINVAENGQPEFKYPIYFSRQNSIRRSNRHNRALLDVTPSSPQPRGIRRERRRLVRKNGKSLLETVTERWQSRKKYGRDLVNTIVNSRWRWTLLILSSCYLGCWFVFATLYMVIAMANGDATMDAADGRSKLCFGGIESFGGFVMFSIETQQTIGYGSRFIYHHCPEAVFVMCCQLIFSCAICGGMLSIAYMKLANYNGPNSASLFSRNAVICMRDGVLCLIFRVRDLKGRYSVGTNINAYLVQSRSEPHEPVLKGLQLEPTGALLWPLEIVHKITPTSPFYNLSAKDLVSTKMFEFIVTMQGTSVHTGQCSKSKSSYLSTELKWGYRFKSCVSYSKMEEKYIVNHQKFHMVEEVIIPLCSAQRLTEVISELSPNCTTTIPKVMYGNGFISTVNNLNNQIYNDGTGIIENHHDNVNPQREDAPLINSTEIAQTENENKLETLPMEVYEYVNKIKEENSRNSNSSLHAKRTNRQESNSSVLDVELLISSLQNFVDVNIVQNNKS